MEEKTRTDLQQPEINTEYVEYLFSGKKPKKPVSKKAWIILGSAILAVVVACLALRTPVENWVKERWQTRCREAYEELVERGIYHFTLQKATQTEGKDPETTEETECWIEGNNRLQHYIKKQSTGYLTVSLPDDQHLWLDGEYYSRNVKAPTLESPWLWQRTTSTGLAEEQVSWEEKAYVFSELQMDLSGAQVIYKMKKEAVSATGVEAFVIFQFDLSGNLIHISTRLERILVASPKGYTQIYTFTFYDITQEEVQMVFDKCRLEVPEIEKWEIE